MRSLSIPTLNDEGRNIIPTSQIYEFYEIIKHVSEIPSIQFIFGSKGCGKSTALKYYIEHEKNNRWLSIYKELSITLSCTTTIESIKNELKNKLGIDLCSLDRSDIDINELFISTLFIDNAELLSEGLLEIFLKLHHNLSTPLIFL